MSRKAAVWAVAGILILGVVQGTGQATPVAIDVNSSRNGITDIYSATFDPPLSPCGGSSPPYCAFFGGDPPATRQLVITPNPTTVSTGIPGGITGAPSGSYLDLTLSGGNTSLTIAGGSIRLPVLVITISGSTVVTATGAGFVVNVAPQVAAVDANGRAEFLVNLAPATAVDFSTLSEVVTSCTGPLCGLIPILTLDMIRYRLVIDYDPTFTSFTGSFIGQTANNSLVFATLHRLPEITVTDSVAPAGDLVVPFGDVTELTTASETVTVTNDGAGDLLLGNLGAGQALGAPFSLGNDNCSGQALTQGAACTFEVTFSPTSTGSFASTLDIPSNDGPESSDGAEPAVIVSFSGNGTPTPVPNIVVTDSTAPASDGLVSFGSVLEGAQADATVTVTNNGNAALVLGPVAVANGLLAPYSIVNDSCSSQTLAPAGGNCTLTVRFEPTTAGSFPENFDIPSNDPDTPAVVINVAGTGTALAAPDIVVTDPTVPDDDRQVSFDGVRPGGSFDRLITIVNAGTADLLIGAIAGVDSLMAPFSIVAGADGCSGTLLMPAAQCTVRLRFEPSSLGQADDTFDIPSNDADEPTVVMSLSGEGVESPPAAATPSPDGADSGFMAVDPGVLLLLGAAAAWGRRRPARR